MCHDLFTMATHSMAFMLQEDFLMLCVLQSYICRVGLIYEQVRYVAGRSTNSSTIPLCCQ